MTEPDPALCRRRVREALRGARQGRGLTQQQAAAALEWSLSKLMRIETGKCAVSVTDLRALLDLYHLDEAEASLLTQMARRARQRPWFARYPVVGTVPGLAGYLDAETSAAVICSCSPVVPDLLQTADYARAFLHGLGQDQADERAGLVMARQQLLDRADGPQINCLLDEGALYRCCGGPAVMRGQLRRLADLAGHPRISVRVVPFTAGAYPAYGTPFTIIDFPGQATGPVYLGTVSGTVIQASHDLAGRYRRYFTVAHAQSAGISAGGLLTRACRTHTPTARTTARGPREPGAPGQPGHAQPATTQHAATATGPGPAPQEGRTRP